LNPIAAPVCMATIGLTVLCSLATFGSPRAIRLFGASPWEMIHDGRWYQMLTSGFLHAGMGHLFMNMVTLYFFGPPMERAVGSMGFLILYLGSLLSGSLFSLLYHRRDPSYRAIGASGAVSGVIFGFVLFRPFAKIYLFLLPVGVPAVIFAAGYIAISAYGARTGRARIGHAAHLGGAIGGLVLTVLLYPNVISIFLSNFHGR